MLFQLVNVVTFLTCVYVKISDIYINSLFIYLLGGGGMMGFWLRKRYKAVTKPEP